MHVSYEAMTTKLAYEDLNLRRPIQAIIDLDFTNQKEKFVTDEDFVGWTEISVNGAEILYKNYLFLNLKYPEEARLPPSIDVDDFWHGHILDTRRYSLDCERIFGRVLHHNPFFGYKGSAAKFELKSAFERTQELHILEFGAPIYEVR